jgi:energy-converting hydrogenase A subunit D
MMEFYISLISIALMVIGAFGIILLSKPLDKIIMFSILEGGFFLAIVAFKYLDVALVVALLGPLSIIVFLLPVIKINEIRKKKYLEDDY